MSRMTRFDWLRRQSRLRRNQATSRHDRPLRVEPLEDRRMLATFTVSNLSDGAVAAPGDLPGSLRQAIFDANNTAGADTIDFSTTGTITLGGTELAITDAVTITGPGANQLTISANNASRVFNVDDAAGSLITVAISDLTISGGSATDGGGIINKEQLTLTGSSISGNTATNNGAGVYNYDGATLSIAGSTVSGNTATYNGGGVSSYNSGTLSINSSTFSGNSAYSGGGIFNDDILSVIGSSISGNSAIYGGGIYNEGMATITNSTLSGNSATYGGGISNEQTMTVTSSTITGNTATQNGGGIYTIDSLTLSGNLISGNSATGLGNEIYRDGGTANLNDYNLIGDSSQTTAQALSGVSAGANDITATSDGTDSTALASILNTTLAANGGPTLTHALLAGSPAINTGDPLFAEPPNEDQRGTGFPRVQFGRIDVGAYEFDDATIPGGGLVVSTTSDVFDGDYTAGNLSLREALELANANAGADIITFDTALSGETINLTQGQLSINESVTLTGLGSDQLVVDAGGNSRVLQITSGTVDISGLTISGGNADQGGGIRNDYGVTTTLSDVVVTGNTATSSGFIAGGGIWSFGDLTINHSTISNNHTTVGNGSGAGIAGIGNLSLTGSTITGNSSVADGGGIYHSNHTNTLTIADSTISNNYAGDDAGGLFLLGGTITGTTISGNTAAGDDGGGIWMGGAGVVDISNSTISGNTTNGDDGGGIAMEGNGTVNVSHSTIFGNSAANEGGGISRSNGTVTVSHSLVSGNSATTGNELWGSMTLDDYNLIGDSSQTTAQAISGVADGVNDITATSDGTDPTALALILDTTLANNGGPTKTHALVAGSPAIDAGNAAIASPPTNDQRGAPFVRESGTIDIGAYERQTVAFAFPLVVDTIVDENDGDYSAGDRSLRELIGLANGSIGTDTITFDAALSGGTINLTLGQLSISDSVTLTGLGADQLTVDAGGSSRVLQISSGTVNISGLTFSGGNADAGGGIRVEAAATTTLTGMVIDGNTATTTSIFAGGGIINFGVLHVIDSTISNNTALHQQGGGIFNRSGTLTITNSTISGNHAGDSGGGVRNYGVGGGSTAISHSTITGNTASNKGGGIHVVSGSVTASHSIISGNTATNEGNEIHRESSGTANLNDYNLLGDSSQTTAQALSGVSAGANDITATSDGTDSTALASILDTTLADNGGPTQTHALPSSSPALDAGDPLFVGPPNEDQRGSGFPRVTGAAIDIGAFEHLPTVFVVDITADESDANTLPGDLSLREAIELSNASIGPDIITFDTAGVFATPQTITLGGTELAITDGVTITGTGASQLTINANYASRVFNIDDGDTESQFPVAISDLTITGGSAYAGGGIFNNEQLTITSSTVSGNSAEERGGGISNYAQLTITDSTISGNSSGNFAAGIYNGDYTLSITNSTVSGNVAEYSGGGILNYGVANIKHTTITGNIANNFGVFGYGGGISNFGSTLTLSHSLVTGNSGSVGNEIYGTVNLNDFNLIGDSSQTTAQALDGATAGASDITATSDGTDPTALASILNTTLADNGGPTLTHALVAGSPAIDGGNPAVASPPAYDQRGFAFARVVGAQIDIGAVESGAVSADFDLDGVVSGFDFLKWQLGFGTTGTAVHGDGDANIDTNVDNADLDVWELQYGTAAPLVAAASAPLVAEPSLAGETLADVAQVVVASETRESDADYSSAKQSPPLVLLTTSSVLPDEFDLDSGSSDSASTSTSTEASAETTDDQDPWEDAVDEVFASAFE